MSDPLTDIIALLRPRTVFSKGISGAGAWAVRYAPFGHPSFCVVLEGSCRLKVDGHPELTLVAGDFLLLPATPGFTMSGFEAATPVYVDPTAPEGAPLGGPASTPAHNELRHGTPDGPPDVRLLGGYFVFDAPDLPLLVSLLPTVVHVRGVERLSTLVRLVSEEADGRRTGRELVLSRLVEVLLVEALRATPPGHSPPGLLRGLADDRIAPAIQAMHRNPAHPWTVPRLARTAALSRSAFFDRFGRTVGVPPMAYLMAWRMAVAKDLLRRRETNVAGVARQVGYGSASTFSTAFSRYVGTSPGRYGRG